MPEESMPARFKRLTSPELDRALAAAYAIVATADGDVSESEKQRFTKLLTTDASASAEVEGIVSDANALAVRMLEDFEPAYRIASARLKELRERGIEEETRLLVIDVSRALIVADGVLAGREETALTLIAKDLGLPAVHY